MILQTQQHLLFIKVMQVKQSIIEGCKNIYKTDISTFKVLHKLHLFYSD